MQRNFHLCALCAYVATEKWRSMIVHFFLTHLMLLVFLYIVLNEPSLNHNVMANKGLIYFVLKLVYYGPGLVS